MNNLNDVHVIGQMDNSDGTLESANRVYDENGIAPAMTTMCGGGHQPKVIAMRGRGEDNTQQLEIRKDDVTNAITTVSKDCMVMERYAIRKLTARECFRLMGMSDEDYDKAASVVSESQRYRAAGDSIVVAVLIAIFSQLNIQGIPMWNDITTDERYRMINQ